MSETLMKALPIGLGALVVGSGMGYGLHALLADPVEVIVSEPQIVKQELTDEELLAFCDDQVAPERTRAHDAQEKVVDLQAQLDAREAELKQMKAQGEKDQARRDAAAKKWKEMEAEIETLKGELEVAVAERDAALVELKETVVALEKQVKATEHQRQRAERFRDESHQNLWTTFLAESKVSICGWGTPGRLDKCQEAVELALIGQVKDRFMECVDNQAATPILRKAERKDDLPQFAVELSDDSRFTKRGWYIQYCDPTLPEADFQEDFDI